MPLRQQVRRIDGHDVVIDADTSIRMGNIRQKDTKPERIVRRILHMLGHRYRTRNRDLPGSPDIANRNRRWAVFVHGCFWHRHSGCRKTTTPKRNAEFWAAKFARNVERDRDAALTLREHDYEVLVVWECETEKPEQLYRRLSACL